MIIEIDDKLSGSERRRLILIKQVEYAMRKFDNRRLAAIFLGVSPRAFRNWCHRYPELNKYRKHDTWLANHKDRENYLEMLRRYPATEEGWDESLGSLIRSGLIAGDRRVLPVPGLVPAGEGGLSASGGQDRVAYHCGRDHDRHASARMEVAAEEGPTSSGPCPLIGAAGASHQPYGR